MRKQIILATMLLCSSFSFASQYEYANDKYCIYEINVGEQTASVVNFYSDASVVTIPSSFLYQGDEYIVTTLGYKDLKAFVYEDWLGNAVMKSYGKYSYEEYDQNRASIVELNLPQTLKHITYGAFKGMTRLKRITIPSSVETVYEGGNFGFMDWFGGNSRLENITFEGMLCYSEWRGSEYSGRRCKICLNETINPSNILDSLKNSLSNGICPRLQTMEVLPIKNYIFYSNKLKDTISVYRTKLKSHPYYVDNDYFNNVKINGSNGEELKEDYNMKLIFCREEYERLWDNMEQKCKQEYPDIYATRYCANNPEFSAKIDKMLKDYKCEYTMQKLVLAVLNNIQLGEKCQDKLWKQYSHLYKSQEDFLFEYDQSYNIMQDIRKRENISKTLRNQIINAQIATKGFYDLGNPKDPTVTKNFRHNYDEMKKYGIPVPVLTINQDPKAKKEFEKNGQYFDSPDDFFAAYITSNYNNILKEKKNSKK